MQPLSPALEEQLSVLRPQYERDGAVCVRGAFGPEWLAMLDRGVERNIAAPGPMGKTYTPEGKPGRFFADYCNWQANPEFREFLLEGPAAAIVGRIMGATKVNLFHEHVLVKEPGTLEPTPWHHDQPYWTVDGDMVCSLWMALEPVPREAGVEYIAGSHRWGRWFRPKRFADQKDHPTDEFETLPDMDTVRRENTVLGWDLAPGDCVVFHGLTLHGAPGNALPTRRRAVSSRWSGDDATYVLRRGFMSPPPLPGAPEPGAPMDSALYPVVWRA
ncbi:phytanoyl-CoA dioxygenase family protein [Roseomonas sp. OT10]|uniref:phytanoyl-CoA dioxygenase family protein n=1 Tax=Roseomonas cutis TaxID=2897332 RepID=UPI001E4DB3E4|nr:phytanoyl-CoA dioxygenase family protein [Roseomonas sp. OT10]UFN51067.1 phytanoyl-CoA dioxygenase family protein [Roseomonas sp. OT10]